MKNQSFLYFLFFLLFLSCIESKVQKENEFEIYEDIIFKEEFLQIAEEAEELEENEISFYITVNEIPEEMNCKFPYIDNDFKTKNCKLLLPLYGWTLDVFITSDRKKIRTQNFEIKLNVPIANGKIPAGENILKIFKNTDYGFSFYVSKDYSFPESKGVEVKGKYKEKEETFVFDVMQMPPFLDPFAEVDVWLLLFSRDIFSTKFEKLPDGEYLITSKKGGNGKSDFDEALEIIGLFHEKSPYNMEVKKLLFEKIRKHLHKMFYLGENGEILEKSVRIKFFLEGDVDSPNPLDFSKNGKFSMIAIGGDSSEEKYFGMAEIDWNNQKKENNAEEGYGVFVANMVRKVATEPAGKIIFDVFNPIGGKPFGTHPEDGLILNEKYLSEEGKARYTLFWSILELSALAISAVCAHEIGHSVGLVPWGAPPEGLFAGLKNLSFIESETDKYHIDTKGLNIMQTGASLLANPFEIFSSYPSFNPLNISYLRRQLIVTNSNK